MLLVQVKALARLQVRQEQSEVVAAAGERVLAVLGGRERIGTARTVREAAVAVPIMM